MFGSYSSYPIGSMYAIYGNIYHQYTPNVSIYTIHGSYGYPFADHIPHIFPIFCLVSNTLPRWTVNVAAACKPPQPLPRSSRSWLQLVPEWGSKKGGNGWQANNIAMKKSPILSETWWGRSFSFLRHDKPVRGQDLGLYGGMNIQDY